MPAIRILGFDGVVPRQSPTMLGPNQAQIADNVKLYSRELRCWRGPTAVYTPGVSGVETIYRMPTDAGQWLTWQADVDVVPGPQSDTDELRLYYTGDGAPKKTNLLMGTASPPFPHQWLYMGVPPPVTAPNATAGVGTSLVVHVSSAVVADDTGTGHASTPFSSAPAGGGSATVADGPSPYAGHLASYVTVNEVLGVSDSGSVLSDGAGTFPLTANSSTPRPETVTAAASSGTPETRVYVYTYVAQFGTITEESAPSPPSNIVEVPPGQIVTINGFATTPLAGYNIVARRIYRSVTGATTDSYEFVDEIAVSQTSYVDSKSVDELGEVLSTIGWLPPPDDMLGLIQHPSGSLVGFEGNTVYFSVPGFPHAWPIDYAITVPYNIVALGIFATTVVVATEKFPYLITGPYPGAMSNEQVPIVEPCVGKRTLISDDMGVAYASPNGLVTIGPTLRGLITEKLFRREEWEGQSPETMIGVVYDGKYIGIRPGQKALVLSRDDIPALSYLTLDATAAFVAADEARLYAMGTDNIIYQIDSSSVVLNNYQWRSKRVVLEKGVTLSCMRLDAKYEQNVDVDAFNAAVAELQAENQTIFAGGVLHGEVAGATVDTYTVNGSAMHDLPVLATERTCNVLIYADGDLVCTLSPTSFDPVRLPPFRAREIEIEMVGNVNIRSVTLATTVRELYADGE